METQEQIKWYETELNPILSASLHDAAPLGKPRGRPVLKNICDTHLCFYVWESVDNFWSVVNLTFALIEFHIPEWAFMSLLLYTAHFRCFHASYNSSLKLKVYVAHCLLSSSGGPVDIRAHRARAAQHLCPRGRCTLMHFPSTQNWPFTTWYDKWSVGILT